MKRLRHPIRAIREPFGTAGLIVACVALVAALGGTAFAAAKLNSTQKKEVEKIAKKFAGKPGVTGPAGTAGAAGKEGPQGKQGEQGTQGKQGEQGIQGLQGEPGQTGFTETLPSEKTETGAFVVGPTTAAGELTTAISFPIPLADAPAGTFVTKAEVASETVPAACIGNGVEGSAIDPRAAPGQLCLYENLNEEVTFESFFSPGEEFGLQPSTTGAIVFFGATGANKLMDGSWAVTAE